MRVHLIAAVARNGIIGVDGDLPWRLPADLGFFKRTTSGHCIVMGRKTHESIGRALPKRTNIVITRQRDYQAPGCVVVHGFEDALREAANRSETDAFVIGGEAIYAMALEHAHDIHLTRVEAEVAGDARFPDLDPEIWEEIACDPRTADENNQYDVSFTHLRRRTPGESP